MNMGYWQLNCYKQDGIGKSGLRETAEFAMRLPQKKKPAVLPLRANPLLRKI